MKKKANNRYNQEFKESVVELYQAGQSVRDLSSEYGISDISIYKWIKAYTPISRLEEEKVTPHDLQKMKKEMRRLQEENDILKKAMAIFAKK